MTAPQLKILERAGNVSIAHGVDNLGEPYYVLLDPKGSVISQRYGHIRQEKYGFVGTTVSDPGGGRIVRRLQDLDHEGRPMDDPVDFELEW